MFNPSVLRSKIAVLTIALCAIAGSVSAQQSNPGIQQSGAVTAGHSAVFGPGVGQIQDGGAVPSAVLSVFGRTGAVLSAANDYAFSQLAGGAACGQLPALTGDISSTNCATTLATVNSSPGAFGGANSIPTFTVNGKGLLTVSGSVTPAIPFTEITGSATCAQLPALTGFVTTTAGTCASVLAGTVPISNGGTGQITAAAALAALMPTPTRAGDLAYWSGTTWLSFPGNNSGTQVLTENASGGLAWSAAGAGTLTTLTAGTNITFSSGATCTTTCTINSAHTSLTNSLSANVALNNTSTFFDAPSVAQGTTGTWFASGSVALTDSVTAAFICKLYDGTTIISSGGAYMATASQSISLALSGVITNPAGNIRIACRDTTSVNGSIGTTSFGLGNASSVTVVRLQ